MVIQPRAGDVDVWTWLVVFSSLARRDCATCIARWVPRAVPTLVVSIESAAVTLAVRGPRPGRLLDGWQPMTMRGHRAA